MSDQSLVSTPAGAFAATLAARTEAGAEARRKTARRAVVVAAVAALHVLILYVAVISERIPKPVHAAVPVEVQLTLVPIRRAVERPTIINATPFVRPKVREFIPEPIIVSPAITPQQAEVNALRALGQALACGASRYEYLSQAERRLCRHAPWKMPSQKVIAIVPPPPPPNIMTGAEAESRFRQTAKPCPILQNTPCIDQIIYGKGPH